MLSNPIFLISNVLLVLRIFLSINAHAFYDKTIVNNNRNCFIYFERQFEDTASVYLNDKLIFKEYLLTVRNQGVCEKVCKVSNLRKRYNKITIVINKVRFNHKLDAHYRYYYINYFNNKINFSFSNELREYY